MITRQVRESPIDQGEDEQIAYTLTTTPWGSSPTSLSTKLYSLDTADAKTDVTATKMTGSSTASGDIITFPVIAGLAAGTRYRFECKFTCSGNVFEAWGIINGVV